MVGEQHLGYLFVWGSRLLSGGPGEDFRVSDGLQISKGFGNGLSRTEMSTGSSGERTRSQDSKRLNGLNFKEEFFSLKKGSSGYNKRGIH